MTDGKSAYHHGNLRQDLLAHGMIMVERDGANQLSLRDLARGLGVSAAAVYRHFANKEDLLLAIAALGLIELDRFFSDATAAPQSSAREKLEAIGLAYIQFGMTRPHLYRLIFCSGTAISAPENKGAPPAETQHEAPFHRLQALVAACCPADATPQRIASSTIAAWSLVHGFVMLRQEGMLAGLPPEALPDTAAILKVLVV